jgi:hypothetical protein
MSMEEIWKDIEECKGYQVSNLGRIRSVDRTLYMVNRWGDVKPRRYKGKIRSIHQYPNGYYAFTYRKKGIRKIENKLVHRLVAKAFVPGWFEGAVVNHKDENKRNNLPSNLEWVTFAYNLNYGTARQRSTDGHGNSRPVEQIDADGNITNTYPSIEECARCTGKSPRSINRACNKYPKLVTKEGFRYRFKQ